jgi:quercetin dioxygenase-like cupin family protein
MTVPSIGVTDLCRQLMEKAAGASNRRAAHSVYGTHGGLLTQTVIALAAGATLAEHENPGEATLLVLEGRVRLLWADDAVEGGRGDLLVIPRARHSLEAATDAAVLLSVAKRP